MVLTTGQRIKYLRERYRYTQKDVAQKLGVEPAAISKYELDLREPNIETLKALATMFHASIDYILGMTPDILISSMDKKVFNIDNLREIYKHNKKKNINIKHTYTKEQSLIIALNELCTSNGYNSYGECNATDKIYAYQFEDLLYDNPKDDYPFVPQILMTLDNLKDTRILVELESDEDSPIPLNASQRIALYTDFLSKRYNILGLVMSIDANENCRIIEARYQKANDTLYTELCLPRTVLSVHEYIDILGKF